MGKLKKYIIMLIMIIILILSILIVLLKLNSSENKEVNTEGDAGDIVEITNQEEEVKDFSTFKNIENCIQKYYDMMNDESIDFYERDEDGEYKKIDDTDIKKMRLNLLSSKYIKDNNINVANVNQYLNIVNEQYNVVTLKMKKLINERIDQYLAYGICINSNNEISDEFYIIVNVDTNNKTFSIEPILNKYDDISEIRLSNDNQEIQINNYNEYNEEIYNNEKIAKNYLIFYKRLALSKPELLYNYMRDEYKEARFENRENFLKYILDNKEEIQGIRLTKYLVNNKTDCIEFVCKDQYDNVYIFEEELPMQFYLKLDNYTILTDKFKQTYEQVNVQEKVKMNVDRFIQMINRHDYSTSYKCISKGFKNNYFSTQTDFEEFIKNKFFEYNNFQFKKIEQKGENIYVCTIQLTNLLDENLDEREVNIIMQINDNFNFEMSFVVE